MHPNVETFIGCDSSYRAASILTIPPPATAPAHGSARRPSGTRAMVLRLTALTRTPT